MTLGAPGTFRSGVELKSIFARAGLASVLAVTVLSALAHGRADAAVGSCRSDPVIVVNGAVADVVSTLATDPSSVRELDYVVTVPLGSLIGGTTLTIGLGFPEKVTYIRSALQLPGTMRIDATVVTQAGVAPFSTSVQVSTLLGGTRTAGGSSNGTVTVTTAALML